MPGNLHAQLAVKKEGYVKRAHGIEVCKEVADENVGHAITVHVEAKEVKVERGVAQELQGAESVLEIESLKLSKVLLFQGKHLRCLCTEGVGATSGVYGLMQQAMDGVECLNSEMHGCEVFKGMVVIGVWITATMK